MTYAPRRIQNPPNPWSTHEVEWLDEPPPVALEVFEEDAKTALNSNDSPDVGFTWSVNPYRGCQHACAYCFARPTHQYLGFGAGTDFENKIVVKRNAPELLRRELAHARWKKGRETIVFSGVTDCYQPLEASFRITRQCLEICHEFRHPVAIITKSALIRRDAELLGRMAKRGGVHVYVSIPFASDEDARKIEPFASAPSTRFETIRRLAEVGVTVGVAVAPLIPGLNDSAVPEILERARSAGATQAMTTLLRLPAEVSPVFQARLRETFPDRANKVLEAIREMRGGKLYDSNWGTRMHGAGPRWDAIARLFEIQCKRLGFEERGEEMSREKQGPPREETQHKLFGA